MSDILDPIPAERREAARDALGAAFGSSAPASLRPVTGGASGALTYRVEASGRDYLLRIEAPRSAIRDPHRHYACMRTAADAGIAPALRHADPAAGVAIMDFLAERPLASHPGGAAGIARELGSLIARVQATPAFPVLADYPAIIARMLGFVRGSGLVAPGLLDRHAEGFERIREAYRWDGATLVSSHNDPNPRNIIYDGERLWLIDWETAYRNDPLVDVAIIANDFANTPELEDTLLRAWLGAGPTPLVRARLTLMRQLTRIYYPLLGFSLSAAGPRTAPLTDLSAMSAPEFRAAFAEGRLKPGSPETLRELGKMMLAGSLAGLAAPGFEEALAIARQG